MMLQDKLLGLLGRPYGVERYRVRNPEDLKIVVARLATFLEQAEQSVKIAGGELHHLLYDDEGILSVLERLKAKSVKIEFVHSPVLDPETKKLPCLAEEGKLTMQRGAKEYQHHFWIIDGKRVLDEDPHYRDQQNRVFYLFSDGNFLADKFAQEFERRRGEKDEAR